MAQVAIQDINPEIAKTYLAMNTLGQQRIKEILEMLILQLAQTNPENLASFEVNSCDFFDKEAITLAKQRDNEIENGDVIAVSHSALMTRLRNAH